MIIFACHSSFVESFGLIAWWVRLLRWTRFYVLGEGFNWNWVLLCWEVSECTEKRKHSGFYWLVSFANKWYIWCVSRSVINSLEFQELWKSTDLKCRDFYRDGNLSTELKNEEHFVSDVYKDWECKIQMSGSLVEI